MRNLDGQTVGSYLVIEQVALGGMAIIYRAYDAALDRYVALKVLPEYLSHDEEFAARFRAEARSIARLRHPNILPIYGFGEENGLSFFVMELVTGGTLKDLMGEPLPAGRAVMLVRQVADALQYAHDQGIVHRDVKPANVLMARPDWVQLSDFGIARVLEGNTRLTQSGSAFFGTPHYMAPEQAMGQPVSPQTDQYALGIVLYEMLTGTTPYSADTPQAIVYQHIYSSLPLPHTRNAGIPDALERVILKALAKDAGDRFASMSAFAQAAEAALNGGLAVAAPTVEQADASESAFPAAAVTPAFTPIPAESQQGSGTERFEAVAPVAPIRPVAGDGRPVAPTNSRRARLPRWWPAVVAAPLVLIAIAGALLLRSGSYSGPVRLRVVPPPGGTLGAFSIVTSTGSVVKDVAAGRDTATIPSGQYRLAFASDSPIRMDVPFTTDGRTTEVRLGAVGAMLRLKAPGNRIPGYTVTNAGGGNVTDVNATNAGTGIFLRAGTYTAAFAYNSNYSGKIKVVIRPGPPLIVDLGKEMTYFRLKPAPNAPVAAVEVDRPAGRYRFSLNGDSSTYNTVQAIPPGRYRLSFGVPYLASIPFTGKPGSSVVLRLAALYGRLTFVPPRGVPAADFSLNDPRSGKDLFDINGTDAQAGIFVTPGTYVAEFANGSQLLSPVRVTLRAGETTTLNVARRDGRIVLAGFPGVPLPSFTVTDVGTNQALVYGVDRQRATRGLYLAPGAYRLAFESDAYLDPVTATVKAGSTKRVAVGSALGGLRIAPGRGMRLTAYSIDTMQGAQRNYVSSAPMTGTRYLRPGTYRIDLSPSSQAVVGLPLVKVVAGQTRVVSPSTLFATVSVPAAPKSRTVTYRWRDDLGSREIDAAARTQRFLVAPGTYRVSIESNGVGRIATIQLRAGRRLQLPAR